VNFDEQQRGIVAAGFARSAAKGKVTVWACAILPDHAHFVFGPHPKSAETLVQFMKGEASTELIASGLHPFIGETNEDGVIPHCWARGQWIVFLDTAEDVIRSIRYVEHNPEKEGLPRQSWSFVTPFARS
jgi:REP element-mobilizing transposase RayT